MTPALSAGGRQRIGASIPRLTAEPITYFYGVTMKSMSGSLAVA